MDSGNIYIASSGDQEKGKTMDAVSEDQHPGYQESSRVAARESHRMRYHRVKYWNARVRTLRWAVRPQV